MNEDHTVREALELMSQYRISGVPVTRGTQLVGIITNRDIVFETNYDKVISEVMTKSPLVTAPEGTTLEEALENAGENVYKAAFRLARSIQLGQKMRH